MRTETQFEKKVNMCIDEMKESVIGFNSWNENNTTPNLVAKMSFCKEIESASLKINGLAHQQYLSELKKQK